MTGLVHKDDYYETPPWVMYTLEEWIGGKFILDVSANAKNTKCIAYISEESNALKQDWKVWQVSPMSEGPFYGPVFNNPPRSKNGKFVLKALEQHEKFGMDIVQLLCWNDLGNKYAEKLLEGILNGNIKVKNLGKIAFYKDNVQSDYPSRLSYFAAWYKKR